MKILCVIDSLGSGGAQRQLVELAKGFKERGHNVSFLIYHNIIFYKPELDKVGIPVNVIDEPNYFFRLLEVRKEIRRQNPSTVLSFLEASNFICTIAGFPFRRWKLIVGERSANPQIFKSAKLKFYRYFHLFADFVVANSEENLKIVKKVNPFLKEEKCKVIYNLVNDKWKITGEKTHLYRKDGKFKLVVPASYRRVKNIIGMIEGINLLSKKEKEQIDIEWYGNKNIEKGAVNSYTQAVAKIEEYKLEKTIRLNDATANVDAIIRNADGVGSFSHYEGFPNSLCEGMACGKPLISSKVSDVPLFVLENENGFLFDADSHQEIYRALSKFIATTDSELIAIGEANRQKAREIFDSKKIINQYLSLIN